MTQQEFLQEFGVLENHLFSISPDLPREQGFLNLLKHLRISEVADNKMISNLYTLWHAKNTPGAETAIPDTLYKRLLVAKLDFHIKV